MLSKQIIAGIILTAIGILFFFNNKNMAKGAAKFYQELAKEKNLRIMFKVISIFLIVGGLILIFTR